MARKKDRPPYTTEAAQRLADLYVRRFGTPNNEWASVARAPGSMSAEGWAAYYDDEDPGRYGKTGRGVNENMADPSWW